MKAFVVYESLWGNTAAIAHAIAEGLGADTPTLSTAQATTDAIADADLIVAGAPVHAFSLPRESGRHNLGAHEKKAPAPPNLDHPALRTWIKELQGGCARIAAFETKIGKAPRGAIGDIAKLMKKKGYQPLTDGERFLVAGTYGPLVEGELERARQWGASLRQLLEGSQDG